MGKLVAAFIADAPYGQNILGLRRVLFYLRAQPVDVGINGVLEAGVIVAPNKIQQLRARIDPAWISGELHKKVELRGRELDFVPVNTDAALFPVDIQCAGADRRLDGAGLLNKPILPPENSFHTGEEFGNAEGFGQVIIGPDIQARNPDLFRLIGR